MGLTFWSDRSFTNNEMTDSQYQCAMPLTNLTSITEDMINTAFNRLDSMYDGGDAWEDVLLGECIIL